MAQRDHRKGALPFAFVPIPKDVLTMPEFRAMPTSAKALMLDLMEQYTGKNNGRLCPSWECMQRYGWASRGTLIRAKVALLDRPFAVLTRKGHAPRTAEWIGFTWWKLDYEKSMDIEPRDFAHLNFMRLTVADPNTGRDQSKKREVWSQNRTDNTRKVILRGPKTVPMEVDE
ncbi:MAG: hypothetical protein H0X13_16355 [Ramlibacter sp.]|nr:hypothetical protein [Ramlibacter sp.]